MRLCNHAYTASASSERGDVAKLALTTQAYSRDIV
jgi:hypothetical protein